MGMSHTRSHLIVTVAHCATVSPEMCMQTHNYYNDNYVHTLSTSDSLI